MINQKSIAVLPLENLSSDSENEYFSDGMTEEIINALSKVEGLKVTARTSSFVFKNKREDVRIIGNQLGVASVLEGSIRKDGSRVRISVQLIKTDDGFHIWSDSFDRDLSDVFRLQDEISLIIADKIRENFGHLNIEGHLVDAPTGNLQAYNYYLKARFNHLKWDEDGIQKAIELYSQCIALEPTYADPHFGLAYCFAMAGSWWPEPSLLDKAKFHIEEGFKFDDQAELGYYAQGTLSLWGHWDFQSAQENYIKAIQLNPKYTEAEEGLIELYTAVGDFDSALKHVDQILKINPLSANHFFTKANIFYLKHKFKQAEKFIDQALTLDPKFTHAIAMKQLCLIQRGNKDELEHYLNTTDLAERPQACRLLFDLVNKTSNVDDEVIDRELNEIVPITLFPWNLFIKTQANLIDEALVELKDAVNSKLGQYVNFKNHPLFLPMHQNTDFQNLVSENLNGMVADIGFPSREEKISVLSKEEASPFIVKLTELMEVHNAYLDNSISLRLTAEKIDTTPNKLSYLLNEYLGKNFNEFINGYRLSAFQKLALDPQNSKLTLLGLAYDSGFTSKSVFNDFFKKSTGLTPKEWVKKQTA